jgi:hypothetical protein
MLGIVSVSTLSTVSCAKRNALSEYETTGREQSWLFNDAASIETLQRRWLMNMKQLLEHRHHNTLDLIYFV